jgi:hypothetical protein
VVLCGGVKGESASATFFDRSTLAPTKISLGPGMWIGAIPERHLATFSPSGLAVLLVRSYGVGFSRAQTSPSLFVLLDGRGGKKLAERELSPRCEQMILSADRTRLHILCRGHEDGSKAVSRGLLGKVHTLDSETGEVRSVSEAGFAPPALERLPDGRVLVLAPGFKKKVAPRLIVLDGEKTGATLGLPSDPVQLVPIPGSDEWLVLCREHLIRTDAALSSIVRTVELPFEGSQVVVSPAGPTAWIASAGDAHFGSLVLPGEPALKVLSSGRGSVKAGKMIASVLTIIPISLAALLSGGTPYGYVPPAAEPLMALSADGSVVFVLNRRTQDLTTVDTASRRTLDVDAVGDTSRTLLLALPEGRRSLLVSRKHYAIVQAGEDGTAATHKWDASSGGFFHLLERPGSAELWILRKGGIEVFDKGAGTTRLTLPFGKPRSVWFPETATIPSQP